MHKKEIRIPLMQLKLRAGSVHSNNAQPSAQQDSQESYAIDSCWRDRIEMPAL